MVDRKSDGSFDRAIREDRRVAAIITPPETNIGGLRPTANCRTTTRLISRRISTDNGEQPTAQLNTRCRRFDPPSAPDLALHESGAAQLIQTDGNVAGGEVRNPTAPG
jgi:hypothetical protein